MVGLARLIANRNRVGALICLTRLVTDRHGVPLAVQIQRVDHCRVGHRDVAAIRGDRTARHGARTDREGRPCLAIVRRVEHIVRGALRHDGHVLARRGDRGAVDVRIDAWEREERGGVRRETRDGGGREPCLRAIAVEGVLAVAADGLEGVGVEGCVEGGGIGEVEG